MLYYNVILQQRGWLTITTPTLGVKFLGVKI